jgi:hypothetical protein
MRNMGRAKEEYDAFKEQILKPRSKKGKKVVKEIALRQLGSKRKRKT